MSKFEILMMGLIITAFSTCSIAWIKQIQQKQLNQTQIKRIELQEISKDNNPESLKNARKQTKSYLKQLEQTPIIPWVAEPSEKFRLEQEQLSAQLEQLEQALADVESNVK
ncbi:MAG: hypothetical protein WBA77_18225 [Microcoleaceae cyanobacterium]